MDRGLVSSAQETEYSVSCAQSVEKVGRQEKVHEECELFLFFFSSTW
jgi:hypothetical protein